MEKNQNGNNQDNNLPVNAGQPKKGLKTFVDGMRRKYDAIRYSKAGKWVARGLTLLTIGGTAKVAYDKGKASVKPTVVTIEKIPEETDPAAETPAEEESAVEAE